MKLKTREMLRLQVLLLKICKQEALLRGPHTAFNSSLFSSSPQPSFGGGAILLVAPHASHFLDFSGLSLDPV